MTEAEALAHVHQLGLAVQKIRSNCFESAPELGDRSERFFEGMFPWFFGDRCVLQAVAIVEGKGAITGGEFYNLMWIAHREHEGHMLAVHGLASGVDYEFPEPDLAWIRGWDS